MTGRRCHPTYVPARLEENGLKAVTRAGYSGSDAPGRASINNKIIIVGCGKGRQRNRKQREKMESHQILFEGAQL